MSQVQGRRILGVDISNARVVRRNEETYCIRRRTTFYGRWLEDSWAGKTADRRRRHYIVAKDGQGRALFHMGPHSCRSSSASIITPRNRKKKTVFLRVSPEGDSLRRTDLHRRDRYEYRSEETPAGPVDGQSGCYGADHHVPIYQRAYGWQKRPVTQGSVSTVVGSERTPERQRRTTTTWDTSSRGGGAETQCGVTAVDRSQRIRAFSDRSNPNRIRATTSFHNLTVMKRTAISDHRVDGDHRARAYTRTRSKKPLAGTETTADGVGRQTDKKLR